MMEASEITAIEKEYDVKIISYGRKLKKDVANATYQAECYRVLKQVGPRESYIDVDIDVALINDAPPGHQANEIRFAIERLNSWIESNT